MPIKIIAEAGVNHNGDENLALELVEAAAKCGADIIKFQTFTADKLVIKGIEKAQYQKKDTPVGDQHSMLRSLELSPKMHETILHRCKALGVEFMSTAFDTESLKFLISLGVQRIKIPSGELTNHPFIGNLAKFNLPIIMSTGMATMAEVQEAVDVVKNSRATNGFTEPLSDILTVLHCTSNYPTKLEDVNLRVIPSLSKTLDLPTGYSDHTEGISISIAAAAIGATVIEKHITLNKNLPGPDHAASIEPAEFSVMVERIREVERALGSGKKQPTKSEFPIRDLVRRSIVTKRFIAKGSAIGPEDITFLRPGNGIQPRELKRVIGRNASNDLVEGTILRWSDIN